MRGPGARVFFSFVNNFLNNEFIHSGHGAVVLQQKKEYYKVITEHIDMKEQKRLAAVGMSENERRLNAKVLGKMEAMGLTN